MALERIVLPSGTPAMLAGADQRPSRGLVILPDVFGLSPVFESLGERLTTELSARVGVLELFPGDEDVPVADRIATGIRELGEEQILADAHELADRLGVEPVAILGVCVGGMFAMRVAGGGRFDRIVSLYGMVHVPERWQSPDKGDPLEAVRTGSVPVLAIGGTEDEFVPTAHLDELQEAGANVRRFPGATHGFAHDPSRPNHDADAAELVWRAVGSFLITEPPGT